jgi:hypothetical protein
LRYPAEAPGTAGHGIEIPTRKESSDAHAQHAHWPRRVIP